MNSKILDAFAMMAEMLSVILAVGVYIAIIFCCGMMIFWFHVPILYSLLISAVCVLMIFGANKTLEQFKNNLQRKAQLKTNVIPTIIGIVSIFLAIIVVGIIIKIEYDISAIYIFFACLILGIFASTLVWIFENLSDYIKQTKL